ncbi:hypothetical protein GCM10012289_22870 [Nonomuraea cavernae]|uniref:Uncharacterized protein n=1 Tax=Nonomuraea cavernae TaxID=2045107 RepID=A0A917YU87_9ACTN|nr:hypothetical protein GCM10012289_22870 [Nonomuraea cavernae]
MCGRGVSGSSSAPTLGSLRLTSRGQESALRLLCSSREGLSRLVADWGPHPQIEQLCDELTPELLGAFADRPAGRG